MKLIATTLLLFIISNTYAQIREVNLFLNKRDLSTIERETSKFLKAQKLPGMTLVIAKSGKIIFSKSYGYAHVSRKVKLEPKHKMSISNLSQVFTSTAIMKLLEEGKISLEDKVLGPGSIFAKEFPKVRKYEAMVTVRHLLEQTAGKEWATYYLRKGRNAMEKTAYVLLKQKLYKKPGERVYNSGFCYFLLGRIIEKKTGKTYIEYLKEITKDHLESGIGILGQSNATLKDVAVHYDEKGKASNLSNDSYNIDAKNGIVCSPHDFMNLLLSIDGLPAKKDLLTAQAVKIMQSRSTANQYEGKGFTFNQNGDIVHCWYRDACISAYKVRTDGITWVLMANGKSNRSKLAEGFLTFPDNLLAKMKDIP